MWLEKEKSPSPSIASAAIKKKKKRKSRRSQVIDTVSTERRAWPGELAGNEAEPRQNGSGNSNYFWICQYVN